jgi:hypothetical protein
MSARMKHLGRRTAADQQGGAALVFAIVLPAIAVGVAVSVELGFLAMEKSKLQDAADASALAAASEMAFGSQASVLQRAEANAKMMVADIDRRSDLDADASVLMQGGKAAGVTMNLVSRRGSFFGDMLPPGGFVTAVSASAMGMNLAPLCVFGTSEKVVPNSVNISSGKVTAGACVIHSNTGVNIGAGSTVVAGAVQAGAVVTGKTTAPTRDGAEVVADPFKTIVTAPPSWTACTTDNYKAAKNEVRELNPGVHCGNVDVDNTATLRLKPGVHYFSKKLQMKESSRLEGDNATIVFGPNLDLSIDSLNVRWDLYGAQKEAGALAGFVLVLDRARTNPIVIPAKIVERLEGVVYAPEARFTVDGAADAAGESAWTVLVGKDIRATNNAHIFINADYNSSDVPVPQGVGNRHGFTRTGNRLVK